MNTVTLAATAATATAATPSHDRPLARLLGLLLRAVSAPTTPAARQLDANVTTWITHPLDRTVTCEAGTLSSVVMACQRKPRTTCTPATIKKLQHEP